MAEDDQHIRDDGKSKPVSAFVLVSEIYLDAESIRQSAEKGGHADEITFVAALRQALLKRSLSDQDLSRVWSILMLGANTTKRVHRERHGEDWQLQGITGHDSYVAPDHEISTEDQNPGS